MSTDEFIKQQNDKLRAIVKDNKPLLFAVRSVMALQSNRIFLKGLDKNSYVIGTYKDREYWINPKNSPKSFPLKGKGQDKVTSVETYSISTRKKTKTAVKNGNSQRETGYFADWLEYKKTIGKNKRISTVDLLWTGELNRSWSNGKVTNPQATKLNANHYVVELSQHNLDKVDRYGVNEVFGLSRQEKEGFMKVLQVELANALK